MNTRNIIIGSALLLTGALALAGCSTDTPAAGQPAASVAPVTVTATKAAPAPVTVTKAAPKPAPVTVTKAAPPAPKPAADGCAVVTATTAQALASDEKLLNIGRDAVTAFRINDSATLQQDEDNFNTENANMQALTNLGVEQAKGCSDSNVLYGLSAALTPGTTAMKSMSAEMTAIGNGESGIAEGVTADADYQAFEDAYAQFKADHS